MAEEKSLSLLITFCLGAQDGATSEGKIRRLAGRRWGDTSYLLGGWSGEQKDGERWDNQKNAGQRRKVQVPDMNENSFRPHTRFSRVRGK